MPWSVNDLPPSAKNLTDKQKKDFVRIANAILEESGDEGKAISIAISQVKKITNIEVKKSLDNQDNFIYAVVYEQNLWTEKSTGRKFTLCKSCNSTHYIDELEDGYCSECGFPLGDAHGDMVDGNSVEKGCWAYLKDINDKASLTTKSLEVIQEIINGESNIEISDIISQLAKNKHHVGFSHQIFDEQIGYPVENHCVRETIEVLDDIYEKITWKAGFIVCDSLFKKCKSGEIVGLSFGGSGTQTPLSMNNKEE